MKKIVILVLRKKEMRYALPYLNEKETADDAEHRPEGEHLVDPVMCVRLIPGQDHVKDHDRNKVGDQNLLQGLHVFSQEVNVFYKIHLSAPPEALNPKLEILSKHKYPKFKLF